MPSLFGDRVAIITPEDTVNFNYPSTLSADWGAGAIKMGLDNIDGWRSTVDLNVISVPRGVGDGAYTATRFPANSRILHVDGYVLATSRSALDTLIDSVATLAFPQDEDIRLVRYEPVPKYVTARLAGPFEVTQYQPEGNARWTATLLCSDPYKYDAINTLSGSTGIAGLSSGGRSYPRVYPLQYIVSASGSGNSVTINNIGTAKTYPTFTIIGPLNDGWRINNVTTSEQMGFSLSLSAGDTLVIDTANQIATLNGSPVSGLLEGDWLSLPRGTSLLKLYGDYNALGSWSVTATSRWR